MMGEISSEDFGLLCSFARELNEYVPPERLKAAFSAPSDAQGSRPGDEFNRRAQWEEILAGHGWRVDRVAGEVTYWTRPGKGRGVSASTGFCKGDTTGDLLYVWSSNADPFEPGHAYDKFGALTTLEHHGDFSTAAKWLAANGYGSGPEPTVVFPNAMTRDPVEESGRRFKWSSELAAPEKAEDWLWEGYLPSGGIVLLSALWKIGKTTLLTHLLRACGAGGEFLGKPLKALRVLYVSEEGERHWVRRRDSLALSDNVGFYLQPFATRPAQAGWLEFVKLLTEDVSKYKFDLVVFDTLAKLWPVQEENDAGAVDAALMPLWEVTKAGASVLLIHHLRKSGGQEYTGSRGSGALSAFPDILIELVRHDASDTKSKKRVLRAKGRYEETPDELVIELVDGQYVHIPEEMSTNKVTFNGSITMPENLDDNETLVFEMLANGPAAGMSSGELRKAIRESGRGTRDGNVSVALTSLYTKKQVDFTGVFKSKSNPQRWYLICRNQSHAQKSAPKCVSGHEITGTRSDEDETSHAQISCPPATQGWNDGHVMFDPDDEELEQEFE
jgi:hypothetical protein